MPRGPFFRGPVFRNEQTLLFSPDGQSIVAARNSLTDRGVFVIGLWDVNTGRELGVMPDDPERIEHTGMISCLAFSPDGRLLATASMDHSIRLWDFAGRRRLVTLQGHANEVWTLAFSPDGHTLASGARDGGVKLWTTNRESKPNLLAGPWMPVSFSKDGRWLAALQPPGTLAFINLETRAPERLFPVDPPRFGFEPGVALSDDLKTMIQVAGDGRIQVVDTQSGNRSLLSARQPGLDCSLTQRPHPDHRRSRPIALLVGLVKRDQHCFGHRGTPGFVFVRWPFLCRISTRQPAADMGCRVAVSPRHSADRYAACVRGGFLVRWPRSGHDRRTRGCR
jgi:dipeptidyl aminopeptidase/acylaminoacyl peptidase